MAGKLNVYGWLGVNTSKAPHQLEDGELTKAQNAQLGSDADGALDMRGGMEKLTTTVASGSIGGFIGVPLLRPVVRTFYRGDTGSAFQIWRISTENFTNVPTVPNSPRAIVTNNPPVGNEMDDVEQPAEPGRLIFNNAASVRYPYLIGTQSLVYRSKMYYGAAATNGHSPTVRIFEKEGGNFNFTDQRGVDFELSRLPIDPAAVLPDAVTNGQNHLASMIAANGRIYISCYSNARPTNPYLGRVFEMDPETGELTQIGNDFPSGFAPTPLCWWMGRLWAGTNTGLSTDAGRVYWIRPGIDADWTLDLTTGAGQGNITSMCVYRGELYVGCMGQAGTAGLIRKRTTLGVWSTSDTGSGTLVFNAYTAMVVFNDQLYACYTTTTGTNIFIRRFNGTAWSQVANVSGDSAFVGLVRAGKIFFCGGSNLTEMVIFSSDGTTWTTGVTNIGSGLGSQSFEVLVT